MPQRKKYIAIDFDGVIHNYKTYKGKGIFNEPIFGTAKFIQNLRNSGWKIIIHTTRREKRAIIYYLRNNEIPFDYFNFSPLNAKRKLSTAKPLADIYLDDRAIHFDGVWSEDLFNKISSFAPHYEKKPKTVQQMLQEASITFMQKNKDYGNSFSLLGKLMMLLFPKGVILNTEKSFNKFGIFIQIVHKMTRYANLYRIKTNNFESVQDTLKDLGIYSFMGAYLESQLDEEQTNDF